MGIQIDARAHWNRIYKNSEADQLGWYEKEASPSIQLINLTEIGRSDKVFIAGAGVSTLIDWLVTEGYENIYINDISEPAINKLKTKFKDQKEKIHWIIDDLTAVQDVSYMKDIKLWHDRAVLHFFTNKDQQKSYFELINSSVTKGGYLIIGAFSEKGPKVCSGLPVIRYTEEKIAKGIGGNFLLVSAFDFTHFTPEGEARPYVYTLFRKDI